MDRLNYHHLRYFREVAHEGNLTNAAKRLNVSQSALSTQIRNLEDRIGHALFERDGRQLVLTEAGKIALDHADRIFQGGKELLAALANDEDVHRPLKVGAVSTLSRNFQLQFLRPVLIDSPGELKLSSGSGAVLLSELQSLVLDVVLSTEAPDRSTAEKLVAHKISQQLVGLYGIPQRMAHSGLKNLLLSEPIILPTESSLRTGFDSLVARLSLNPRIAAEVDDMAMVRLLAREGLGVALVPAVVVADEVQQGMLVAAPFKLDIHETFFAITARRQFQHPLLSRLLNRTD